MLVSFAGALRDPLLLGGAFQGASFRAWHTVAKVISGEPLDAVEAALFRRCTGRRRLSKGPVSRLFLTIGRRGGKSRFLSALAVWVATLAHDWRAVVSAGETMVVALVGADRAQARILARYAVGLVKASPLIAPQITREAEDRIEFASGAALEILTNDAKLIRGRSMAALIGDEVCFWKTDDDTASSDEEVWGAAVPSLATAPGGGWAVLSSSPSAPRGLLHRLWRATHAQDAAAEVSWQADSRTMNPTLPEATVRKAYAEDPVRAKSEFGGLWREPGDDFVPLDALTAVTDAGVKDRPWLEGRQYVAFVDGAGGTGKDSFVSAIAHRQPDGVAVLDLILERRPRFVPAQVCAEHAAVLKLFRIYEVRGDAYSAGWVRDEFGRHGISYRQSSHNKSEIYLAVLPMILAGRVRLLDSERLRDQFTSLRRRVHSQGRESVDASSASAHEDVANAAAGALVLAGAASPFEDEGIGISECFVRGHGAPGYDDDFEVEQPSLVFGGVA